jgi:hypothetical protein
LRGRVKRKLPRKTINYYTNLEDTGAAGNSPFLFHPNSPIVAFGFLMIRYPLQEAGGEMISYFWFRLTGLNPASLIID